MKSLKYFGVICFALAVGFWVGRLSNPTSAKASGLSYVVRVATPTVGSPSSLGTLYGSPVSLSCSADACYVLATQSSFSETH